ncbi:TonB family protein [Hymenobacter roseosalivarius]|uniref:TonB family protein n=1 Tax=Hymenobacter roseosalivarius TaxID=89967 RepID=UPI001356358B|nr:TonB family protein [Hymenobacter roseosalivarius]
MPPEPGGHLPVALLRQYVAGTLAPAAQHRVESHTLTCQRCAEVLEGLEMTDAATTDHSLTDLQRRLRARVAQDADSKPAANWPWLQMAGVLLLLIASIIGWRLNQARTEAQSEPVAALMRRKDTAAAQQEAVPQAVSKPELKAMESKPAPVEVLAAPAPDAETSGVAPSLAAAASRPKATSRTRSARIARPASTRIAALKTETFSNSNKDKVVADSVSTADLAAASYATAAAAASAPLPPDRTRTSLARTAAPAAGVYSDSGKQVAKMPPGSDTRSLASKGAPATGVSLVRGRITDQNSGEGLPGVTVLVKGTKLGTSTQADGSFTLPIADSPSTLTIASIGYQTREYKLTNPSAPLTLALPTDTRSLGEVVVTRKGKMPVPPAVGPTPTGGLPAFHQYLKEELEYPERARQERTEGTVKLKFTVTANGAIEDLKIVRGLSKECDTEALRLVREGPAWFPGITGGRRTAQQVRLLVPFRLP